MTGTDLDKEREVSEPLGGGSLESEFLDSVRGGRLVGVLLEVEVGGRGDGPRGTGEQPLERESSRLWGRGRRGHLSSVRCRGGSEGEDERVLVQVGARWGEERVESGKTQEQRGLAQLFPLSSLAKT